MKFFSKSQALTLQLTPGSTTVINGKAVKEPGMSVTFVNGVFETDEEGIINKIKETPAFKNGDIAPVTEDEMKVARANGRTSK